MTTLSFREPEVKRLESLHVDLARLKNELASAWASPHGSARVPVLEGRIREMWDQIDHLAISLGEPEIGVGGRIRHTGTAVRA